MASKKKFVKVGRSFLRLHKKGWGQKNNKVNPSNSTQRGRKRFPGAKKKKKKKKKSFSRRRGKVDARGNSVIFGKVSRRGEKGERGPFFLKQGGGKGTPKPGPSTWGRGFGKKGEKRSMGERGKSKESRGKDLARFLSVLLKRKANCTTGYCLRKRIRQVPRNTIPWDGLKQKTSKKGRSLRKKERPKEKASQEKSPSPATNGKKKLFLKKNAPRLQNGWKEGGPNSKRFPICRPKSQMGKKIDCMKARFSWRKKDKKEKNTAFKKNGHGTGGRRTKNGRASEKLNSWKHMRKTWESLGGGKKEREKKLGVRECPRQ